MSVGLPDDREPEAATGSDPVAAFWARLSPGHRRTLIDQIDLLPTSAFIKDRNSVFIHVNKEFVDRLGVGRSPVGGTDEDVVDDELAAVYLAADLEVMEREKPLVDFVDIQQRSDGTTTAFTTSKLPIRDDNGDVIGLLAMTTEVPDPERIADELRTSEQRYALAARASRDGIWDFDLAKRSLTLSPRCSQLFGLPAIAGSYPWDVLRRRMGDDEAAKVLDALKPLHDGTADSVEHVIHFRRVDGTSSWLGLVATGLRVEGSVIRLVGSLADVTEERQRAAHLERQASQDDLTGLANRRRLMEHLEACAADDTLCSLLALDLDHFKVINDSLGHQAGDRMLLTVAARLERLIDDSEMLARLGGDEFAILVQGGDHARAEWLAEAAVAALDRPVRIDGLDVYSTASVGVAHRRGTESATELLRSADIALYDAKAEGKACVRVYTPQMGEHADHELELQIRLRRAVANHEFRLHYQPIHHSNGHGVAGVEALLRWYPEGGDPEPPATFLAYLERTGLIIDVGHWVIDEACRQLGEWVAQHPEMRGTHLALNISRVQFRRRELVQDLLMAIQRNGLDPSQIIVEITETAVSEDASLLLDALDELRAAGVRIAVDDFGVGQSSLSVLYDLPVDLVKIDKSFTERLGGDGDLLVDAILRIAETLELECIAEGVETVEQDAWLRANGCRYVQGWLLAKAMPPEQVPSLFQVARPQAA